MSDNKQGLELKDHQLYEELGQLRSVGLWPAIKAGNVRILVSLAYEVAVKNNATGANKIKHGTAAERHRAAGEQIGAILEAAAEQLDGGRDKAAVELFALALAPDAKMPDIAVRRMAAAGKVHYTVETFKRHHETPLLEALTKLLLEGYGPEIEAGADTAATANGGRETLPDKLGGDLQTEPHRPGPSLLVHHPQRRLRRVFAASASLVVIAAVVFDFVHQDHSKAHATQHKPTVDQEYIGLRKHVPPGDTQLEAGIYVASVTRHEKHFRLVGALAEPGDQLALEAHFMNLANPGGRDAFNVRLTIGLNQAQETRDHAIRVAVKARNAPEVRWATHVLTAQPTRLVLVPGTVTWKHNTATTESHPHWVVSHLNDYVVTDSIGTVIDRDQRPANKFSETVVFQVLVEEGSPDTD
jgi:hypothetical protein